MAPRVQAQGLGSAGNSARQLLSQPFRGAPQRPGYVGPLPALFPELEQLPFVGTKDLARLFQKLRRGHVLAWTRAGSNGCPFLRSGRDHAPAVAFGCLLL